MTPRSLINAGLRPFDKLARAVRHSFNPAAHVPTPAEKWLAKQGIAFIRRSNGTVLVKESIYLNDKGLTELPDLSNVVLDASFHCQNNKLRSLKGAPLSVSGGFFCQNNHLVTLEGAPADVGGAFDAQNNRLISLRGAPRRVIAFFNVENNCLTSVEGAPDVVGHAFWCLNNPLESLHGATKKCREIVSPFGKFASWDDVPDDVRMSKEQRDAAEDKLTTHATVLQQRVQVGRPLRFKRASRGRGGPRL